MRKVFIRPDAKNDVKNIWYYTYNNWGEEQADTYTNLLGQAINEIPVNPEIGSSIKYVRQGYRLYHFKHHLIIYCMTSTVIDIVRVLGENMDVKRHL